MNLVSFMACFPLISCKALLELVPGLLLPGLGWVGEMWVDPSFDFNNQKSYLEIQLAVIT
jgi:hypothetical protein